MPDDVVIEASIQNSQLAMIVTLAAFVICGSFLLSASTFALQPPGASAEPLVPGSIAGDGVAAAPAAPTMPKAGVVEPNEESGSVSPASAVEAPSQPTVQVPFESENKIYFVKSEDISAIRAEGHYTLLYTGGRKLFCPWSITKSAKNLPVPMFFQTHRSYIVNTQKIVAFERRKDTGVCVLRGEAIESVPVSRSKVGDLRELLDL